MNQFASMLKALRQQQALTQEQLARDVGLSKSAISMYECGNREPDLNTLERIARYFSVDMATITGNMPRPAREEEAPALQGLSVVEVLELINKRPQVAQLLTFARQLDDGDLDFLIALVERLNLSQK